MILEELVARLSFDQKLQDLNVQLAAADLKSPEDNAEAIPTLIKKYLKAAGISFDQLTRKVENGQTLRKTKKQPFANRSRRRLRRWSHLHSYDGGSRARA